jgi:hypothetical protein
MLASFVAVELTLFGLFDNAALLKPKQRENTA